MSYNEIKNAIILEYKAGVNHWHQILGAMFEATNGFTRQGTVPAILFNRPCDIIWNNYNWNIEWIR